MTSFSIIARATSWGWATSFGPCVKNILFFFRFDAGKPANSQGGSQAWQSCAISCILELSPWSQTEPGERKLFLLYFENSSWELSVAKQADNEDDNYLSPWSSWRRVNSSSPWDFTKEKRSKRSNVCLIQWYKKKGAAVMLKQLWKVNLPVWLPLYHILKHEKDEHWASYSVTQLMDKICFHSFSKSNIRPTKTDK